MKKQFFFAMSVAAGLAVLTTGCNKSSESANVAVVDGTNITLEQYDRFLERMPTVKVDNRGQPQEARVFGTLGFQALQTLIGQQLLLQVAKEEGVLPDAKEIEAELKFQQSLHPDFVQALQAQQGMTLQEIRDSLQLDRAKEKLITKGINVTKQEAQDYVKSHAQQFSVPAQANLLWIIVQDAKTKATVDKELASGQPFGSVAANYSAAKDARSTGGKYRTTVISQFPPVLQDLIKKTSELKATDWIQDHDNWVKFYVQSKTDAKPQTLDDTKIEAIRRGIAMQKGSQATDLQKKLMDRLKVAKISVSRSPLTEMWKQETQKITEAANDTATANATKPTTAAPAANGTKK